MPLLYQFAASPYCEKARWALDYKGVQYQSVNLIPGPHIEVTSKIAKNTSVPILLDSDKVVQGSAEIISYLEKTVRHPPLTPTNSQDASMAHEWNDFLTEISLYLCACFFISSHFSIAPWSPNSCCAMDRGGAGALFF